MAFSIDNSEKFRSGYASNMTLDAVLNTLESVPQFNISVERGYQIGAPSCEKQYKMDFKITFHNQNDEIWLVKSTSSIRSDRLYGVEYFAQNIKLHDPNIAKILVVIPNSVNDKEIRYKNNYREKINCDGFISFIDEIYTVSEFRNEVISFATSNLDQGICSNILGKDAEKYVEELLVDTNNSLLWNDYENNFKTTKSASFNEFCELLTAVGLEQRHERIISVKATRDIPKLSNGGYPKTDVSFVIQTENDLIERNVSIKHTESKTVTIHEGDINDVITALEIDPISTLADALKAFQLYGSEKKLKEEKPHLHAVLHSELPKFNDKLTELFLFGVNSPLVNHKIQIADLILLINNFDVFDRDSYVSLYVKNYKDSGQFGTPFKWTYPSKKRGKKIQIKGFTGYKK